MNSSTSHRPWESTNVDIRTPPAQAQQTLPSITTLTANMSAAPSEQPPLNLSMSAVQRDSGAWSMPPSTRKHYMFPYIPSCFLSSYHRLRMMLLTQRQAPRLTQPALCHTSIHPSPLPTGCLAQKERRSPLTLRLHLLQQGHNHRLASQVCSKIRHYHQSTKVSTPRVRKEGWIYKIRVVAV